MFQLNLDGGEFGLEVKLVFQQINFLKRSCWNKSVNIPINIVSERDCKTVVMLTSKKGVGIFGGSFDPPHKYI